MMVNKAYIKGCNIGKKKKFDKEKELLSLSEYLSLARRCISLYAPKIRAGLAKEMLQNEDTVSSIANSLMMADYDFDGRGTLFGYRKTRVMWAIHLYVDQQIKNSKRVSQVYFSDLSKEEESELFNPKDHRPGPEKQALDNEKSEVISDTIQSLFDENILSETQKKYIKLRYIDGLSVAEIAERYNIKRQGVHESITKAISKIQDYFHSKPTVREIFNV